MKVVELVPNRSKNGSEVFRPKRNIITNLKKISIFVLGAILLCLCYLITSLSPVAVGGVLTIIACAFFVGSITGLCADENEEFWIKASVYTGLCALVTLITTVWTHANYFW
jgi:VIT1/CCC1 family predicted Fe2+/Mn2+ transporter